jgi:hypothetical protein
MRNTRFLYVIGDGGPAVKIGVADRLAVRLSTLQVGNPNELAILYDRRVLYRLAASTELKVHQKLKTAHRRGEWFEVSVETAKATIDEVYQHLLDTMQAPIEPEGLLDLSRNSDYDIDAAAPEAIAWFRTLMNEPTGKEFAAKVMQGIQRTDGKAAAMAFQWEIVSQMPVSRVLHLRPGDLRQAHAALAKAINTLCDVYRARREQSLLDKIRGIAA